MLQKTGDTPQSRAGVLAVEVERFTTYLGSLPPEAWDQPSACEGWTVAHVAMQPFALQLMRGLSGDFSPPEGSPAVAEHDEDRFAENIYQRALSSRERLGGQLLEDLSRDLDEAVQLFKNVGPNDWDKLCYWPPGPEPVRTLLDMRISELTMHAWDIRSVLEEDYHLSEDSVRVLIDTVPRAVRRAFRPDPSLRQPIRYRFIVTEPVSNSIDLVAAAEGTRVEIPNTEPPDVTFRCRGETYVLVMYGRLKPGQAIADDGMAVVGNMEVAAGFGQRFKGG